MHVALLVTGILLGSGTAAAPPGAKAALLERAEREFRQGVQARAHPEQARRHFRAAFEHYEALRRAGAHNPELYRNQGNAALLAEDLPAAILAYRRGLRLAPGDGGLRGNLDYAREQVAHPAGTSGPSAADPWPSWLPRPSDDLLLGLALGLYSLAWLAAARWLMTRRGLLLTLSLVVLLLGAGLGVWWATRQEQADEARRHPLVVVAAETTPLHTGNGRSYPSHQGLPAVTRGMEGYLQFIRGDWLQVAFPGGQVGWLERASVLIDEP